MIYRFITVMSLPLWLLAGCAPTGTHDPLTTGYEASEIAQANVRLGAAYMEEGDFETALNRLERARRADPQYPAAYHMLGLLHQRLGQFDEAERNFRRALSLAPNDWNILNSYGQYLCNRERPVEAEEAFLKARRNPLNERPEIALTNAGTCAVLNDDQEQAENYFREALSLNPNIPAALFQMSNIKYNQGEYLTARGYLQRFSSASQHNPRSLWLGIRIENELGDRDAVSSYALLLNASFPDSNEARLLRESGIR
jgi:type IV pilus assembly protein PilF